VVNTATITPNVDTSFVGSDEIQM